MLAKGVKPGLNRYDAYELPLDVPPKTEQHRIVAKVDELMERCDRLEEKFKERVDHRKRFTKASFGSLTESGIDECEYKRRGGFVVKKFDRLTVDVDQIESLRQTILDLAVRGRLVKQNPENEPARMLLKRIEVRRKSELAGTKKERNSIFLPKLTEDEFPFEIPETWSWTRIVHLGLINPKNKTPDSLEVSFVPMHLIASEYGVSSQHEKQMWGKIKKGYTHFAEGDVGLAKITPCFENGKSTVFRNLTGGVGSGTTELHILRPLIVSADYVLIFLKRQQFIDTGVQKMTGTVGQKRVPLEYFMYSPFPLPPLTEQHWIVAKVDELMEQCDQLEEKIKEREDHRKRFTKVNIALYTKSSLSKTFVD